MSEDHKLSENSEFEGGDRSNEAEQKIVQKDVEEEKEGDREVRKYDGDDCKTPNLEENKIPGAQSCPPAPSRKRKEEQAGLSHKRKLFFENTAGGAEEIESLFENSSSSTVNEVSRVSSAGKRRRKR
ncbi:hypothetical protein DCAR_0521457 [Daucus carota subsp. sativus]|uniref:Uncharacterized protein n=1 Tax=Daucus carota subsp. sativus TaxID=79200 RepID=A0A164Z8F9_DAUCS|nr:hypothetical protein DCAR_0521457 [Daucus carota subsp. sativus]